MQMLVFKYQSRFFNVKSDDLVVSRCRIRLWVALQLRTRPLIAGFCWTLNHANPFQKRSNRVVRKRFYLLAMIEVGVG